MTAATPDTAARKPTLLVLASTYPRWANDAEPGFVHELARRLTNRFHVIVLCPHAQGAAQTETLDGVEVVRYRYAPAALETLVNNGGIVTNLRRQRWKWLLVPSFVLVQAWVAWRLCRARHVDVMHAHWLIPQGVIAALLPSRPPVPFVVTSHGADLYALRAKPLLAVKRFVLRRANAVTVVSTAMLPHVAALGADAARTAVIPMGVDLAQRFVPGDPDQRARNELLFVGRLVEKKGLRHLLAALPRVLAAKPEVTLTIAGFGPEEAALKAQVTALGLQPAVRFLGAVPQSALPALYRRAALFVAPFVRAQSGDQEGLPVALMEAIGCGCPVLVGAVAGLEDIFGDQASAAIIEPQNPAALAAAILERLENAAVAQQQALALRIAGADRLSWDNVTQRYAKLIERAAGRPTPPASN